MKVRAIECYSCKDVVYSRAEEDYRECSCASVNTCGGQTFTKFDAIPGADYKIFNLELNATRDEIYVDWLEMHDKYGIVSPSEDYRALVGHAL
tara:strand:+ start:351 stop:629 length:279 start_codon:yes stop_codon:yes gene_type:complete